MYLQGQTLNISMPFWRQLMLIIILPMSYVLLQSSSNPEKSPEYAPIVHYVEPELDMVGFNESVDISILDTAKVTAGGVFLYAKTFDDSLNMEVESGFWYGRDHLRNKLGTHQYKAFEEELYSIARELRVSMSVISASLWIESMYNTKADNRKGYHGIFQVCRSTYKGLNVGQSFRAYKRMDIVEQLKVARKYWKQQTHGVNYSTYKPHQWGAWSRKSKGYKPIHFNNVNRFMLLQMYPKALKQKDTSNAAKIGWSRTAQRRNGNAKYIGDVQTHIVNRNLKKLHRDYTKYWGL